MFTDKERKYIGSQTLGRIGTVNADGQPDVAPVGFNFDGEYFYVGGRNNKNTRKYRNVVEGRTQVGLAIDHLESTRPWVPMGIKIYGTADIVEYEGYAGKGPYLRIQPTKARSWGID
jgi:pyridoxamine 5'-phosphate oxidase family protein